MAAPRQEWTTWDAPHGIRNHLRSTLCRLVRMVLHQIQSTWGHVHWQQPALRTRGENASMPRSSS